MNKKITSGIRLIHLYKKALTCKTFFFNYVRKTRFQRFKNPSKCSQFYFPLIPINWVLQTTRKITIKSQAINIHISAEIYITIDWEMVVVEEKYSRNKLSSFWKFKIRKKCEIVCNYGIVFLESFLCKKIIKKKLYSILFMCMCGWGEFIVLHSAVLLYSLSIFLNLFCSSTSRVHTNTHTSR